MTVLLPKHFKYNKDGGKFTVIYNRNTTTLISWKSIRNGESIFDNAVY